MWALIELEFAERFAKKQDKQFKGHLDNDSYKDVD